jgi:hypothetical protein
METIDAFPPLRPDDVADNAGDVIVHFWARWNSYDTTFAHHFSSAARACDATHLCRSHDTEAVALAHRLPDWGIVNLPAFAFFRKGQHVETIIGLRPAAELQTIMERWLGPNR